ncbi:hypothetical protein [Actinoallomurus sp. NPDC050550]|uniref:hypothetical protein n=1 Tax=Actinoallomurus sp. NPDC050550 TaxID=3154937 RepID=UPI0033EC8D12
MTASRAELERLTPEDMAQYLRGSGWRPAGDLNGRATIWALEPEQLEVIVPVSTRFRDYPQRINEVVRTLAEAESRPEPEIIRSVTAPYVDRQYFRMFPDAPSGMIPAADAAEAFQGVREMLIAAAYVEETRRTELVLPRRKPRVVEQFPERALVTTGPGSFVIATHVELPRAHQLFPATSFERRALLKLRQVVISAQTAAAQADNAADLSPFEEHSEDGISRTMCKALSRLGGGKHDRPIEMRFAWAGAAPTGLPDKPIRFNADQVTMLGHAADDLGRRQTTTRAEMRGKIKSLHREDPNEAGWVVVQGTITAGGMSYRRQVWVPLGRDDYDRALRANGQGLEVRVAGIMTRTGHRTELRPTELFRVTST